MAKYLFKASSRIIWSLEDISWFFSKLFIKGATFKNEDKFTIGITTYKDRFVSCLKPLLKKISILFPQSQIIAIANGHVRQEEQIRYIKEIEHYCKKFKNVELISYNEPKGLSYLWNTIIKQSVSSVILVLNDDLKIKKDFRKFIYEGGILNKNLATINKSWSHYIISKTIVEKVGWFDENLLEIGGEDDDYSARIAQVGLEVFNYNSSTIAGKSRKKSGKYKINSYGKDMTLERGGYSTMNTEYLERKWEFADQYFNGAVLVKNRKPKYWKLRQA